MRYKDYYRDIERLLTNHDKVSGAELCQILSRLLRDSTHESETEFANDAARLYFLCRESNYPSYRLSLIWKQRETDSKDIFLNNALALSEAVQSFTKMVIPMGLRQLLPQRWRDTGSIRETREVVKRIRISVDHWQEDTLWGWDIENPTGELLTVSINDFFTELPSQLYPNAQLNLLDIKIQNGVIYPKYLILDPDTLIDITTICGCIKQYGATPLNYLLHIFLPSPQSNAIQVGNVANQFLDDRINGKEDYLASMQRSLHDYPLQYTTLDIDRGFFEETKRQWLNIKNIKLPVSHSHEHHPLTVLEPSFLCEAMGIQGRMDLLMPEDNIIVELKSGKSQERPVTTYRDEHALQMALYKEILYFNLDVPRSRIETYLLYSRYPVLYDIRLGVDQISLAMNLRNGIVALMRKLRNKDVGEFLDGLTEGDFNIKGLEGMFYENYLLPPINTFLNTYHRASQTEKEYFCRMLRFMMLERQLSSSGDDRPDSERGFAQVWWADTRDKLNAGNILIDLRLEPSTESPERLWIAHIPDYGEMFMPNFRLGDSVMLYERPDDTVRATNRQIHRCTIREIAPTHLLLELAYPQKEARLFSPDKLYAVEPSHMDGTFTTACRGLFAFLSAPYSTRSLILGQRKPTDDDFHLLVGPPGTGKTSIALRNMVQEWLATDSGRTLLLCAYTHRAVDEICGMLEKLGVAFLRIGSSANCSPEYHSHLVSSIIQDCTTLRDIKARLCTHNIIVGTVATMASSNEVYQLWDISQLIVDEASQVLEPQLLPIICHVPHFILIGDHKQLPAVVMQNTADSAAEGDILRSMCLTNCRNSLFERLHALALVNGASNLVGMLTQQGRMHSQIGTFASRAYYGGKLDVVPLPHQLGELKWKIYNHDSSAETFCAERRFAYVNILPATPTPNNKLNVDEALCVARIVATFHTLYRKNGIEWKGGKNIGVIVPFRAQIAAVRKSLSSYLKAEEMVGITIDTVERYQGSQRDVIIFSTAIRDRYQLTLLSEETSDGVDRKLNVAITRAREQFFLVGNIRLLQQTHSYRQLIDAMK